MDASLGGHREEVMAHNPTAKWIDALIEESGIDS
jgi:hypothetical protein